MAREKALLFPEREVAFRSEGIVCLSLIVEQEVHIMKSIQRAFVVLTTFALIVGAAYALAPQDQRPVQDSKTKTMQGELLRVDTDAQTISIKTAEGSEVQFRYTDKTEVLGAQDGVAGLATNSGAQVIVSFTEENQTKIASKIEVKSGQ